MKKNIVTIMSISLFCTILPIKQLPHPKRTKIISNIAHHAGEVHFKKIYEEKVARNMPQDLQKILAQTKKTRAAKSLQQIVITNRGRAVRNLAF